MMMIGMVLKGTDMVWRLTNLRYIKLLEIVNFLRLAGVPAIGLVDAIVVGATIAWGIMLVRYRLRYLNSFWGARGYMMIVILTGLVFMPTAQISLALSNRIALGILPLVVPSGMGIVGTILSIAVLICLQGVVEGWNLTSRGYRQYHQQFQEQLNKTSNPKE